jgi:O-6-methylguanine DNA methyltransferase
MTRCTAIDSPLGPLFAVFGEAGLCRLVFGRGSSLETFRSSLAGPTAEIASGDGTADRLQDELDAYFAGAGRRFATRLDLGAGTPFQQRVWRELQRIPYGQTASYGEVARRIGKPGASRAVGQANGANPVPILVPCHRVIRASGELGGFGSGLDRKRWLLEHERRI